MTETRKVFEALGTDTEVVLKQVTSDAALAAAPEEQLLRIPVDPIDPDVVVGVIDGLTSPVAIVVAIGVFVILVAMAFPVFWRMFRGKEGIDLSHLLSEPDGKASMSRFQALIFTIVVAGSVLVVIIETGDYPDKIPWELLAIMAGSLGTYLMSKQLQKQSGATGNGLDGVLATGPLVRYGSTSDTVKLPSGPTPNGPYEVRIPVTNSGGQEEITVAVALGKCTFSVSLIEPEGGLELKKIKATGIGNAALPETDFEMLQEVETPANAVTEVKVRFKSKAEAGIATVCVKQVL